MYLHRPHRGSLHFIYVFLAELSHAMIVIQSMLHVHRKVFATGPVWAFRDNLRHFDYNTMACLRDPQQANHLNEAAQLCMLPVGVQF